MVLHFRFHMVIANAYATPPRRTLSSYSKHLPQAVLTELPPRPTVALLSALLWTGEGKRRRGGAAWGCTAAASGGGTWTSRGLTTFAQGVCCVGHGLRWTVEAVRGPCPRSESIKGFTREPGLVVEGQYSPTCQREHVSPGSAAGWAASWPAVWTRSVLRDT